MKPGIHFDVPADVYHADPAERPSLTSGIAKCLCSRSPLHAWTIHPRLNPDHQREERTDFDVGTAAHELLLGGFDRVEIIDAPDWRSAAARDARDAAWSVGRLPLLASKWADVQTMVERFQYQVDDLDLDPPVFRAGHPEVVLIWDDDGALCRARLDWLRADYRAVDDYKTTSASANPEKWSRNVFDRGYDVQAAFYARGVEALTGEVPDFRFVVQENSPPYALSVVTPNSDTWVLAQKKVAFALDLWRRCLDSNDWPGYPRKPWRAELPPWEEARWLAKEVAA